MPKEVNGVSVKLQTINNSNKQDNVLKKTNVRNQQTHAGQSRADNYAHKDNDHVRLSKLKRAILSGRFRVNSTRVAEKLIQFEIQLSA